MNDVKIELAINIDGVCSKTMPYEKAKQLYNELSKIFYRPQAKYREPVMRAPKYGDPITTEHTIEKKIDTNPVNELRERIEQRESEPTTNINVVNPMYDRMAKANKRIDEAREKAKQRTSGCGSKKSC